MALTPLVTRELLPLLKSGSRIASMGYPDIVLAEAEVLELVGELKFSMLKFRPDSERICKWHGLPSQRIPDAESLFDLYGAKLDVFDVVEIRGGEIICDLNYPIDRANEYDFVLDVGTIEHCFNIGQAAKNMAGLLRSGGVIFHSNPFVMANHGFYSLNPTWFADFYSQPGFSLMWCRLKGKGVNHSLDAPLTKRFRVPEGEIDIFAAARRDEVMEITWPMQSKYAALAAAGNRA